MTTAFLGHLIFDMDCRCASAFHFANCASNVEGAAPPGIDVYQQRDVGGRSDTADILDHIVQRGHAQIWQTIGRIGNTAAGQVDGLMTDLFRHHGSIGVDGADDL